MFGSFVWHVNWADGRRFDILFADAVHVLNNLCFRVLLQRAAFPPAFAIASPIPRLEPEATRLWTVIKVFIELRDGVSLFIPFREASKVRFEVVKVSSLTLDVCLQLGIIRHSQRSGKAQAMRGCFYTSLRWGYFHDQLYCYYDCHPHRLTFDG